MTSNPNKPKPPRLRRLLLAVLAAAAIATGSYLWVSAPGHQQSSNSEQAMVDRASQVMGFDLNATTHTFTKTADGGVEQVEVKDVSDARNLGLIRSHLQKVSRQFAAGNYSEPAAIHGASMPGLAELQASAGRVQIAFTQLPHGARITYRATDDVLVAALHAWFDAQNNDHSMPGMG